jgi:hypothetical protein
VCSVCTVYVCTCCHRLPSPTPVPAAAPATRALDTWLLRDLFVFDEQQLLLVRVCALCACAPVCTLCVLCARACALSVHHTDNISHRCVIASSCWTACDCCTAKVLCAFVCALDALYLCAVCTVTHTVSHTRRAGVVAAGVVDSERRLLGQVRV